MFIMHCIVVSVRAMKGDVDRRVTAPPRQSPHFPLLLFDFASVLYADLHICHPAAA